MSKLLSFLRETPEPERFQTEVGDSRYSTKINGIDYDIYTSKKGVITKKKCSNYYDTVIKLIKKEFPDSPFHVSLSTNDLLQLDEPFTNENYIIIITKRYQCQVLIERLDNTPITLRQILNKLINTTEYNAYTGHFLQYFEKNNNIQYTACFGN